MALLRAVRPKQWTKNLLLFAALLFSHSVENPTLIFNAACAFVLFCALSGGVYIINDIVDVETDRSHPEKRRRPIASGALPAPTALAAAVILIVVAVIGCFIINAPTGATACAYLLLTFAYNAFLKHVVILDVLAVSMGFVLRAVAGAEAIRVEISPWLLICTILLALFLTLAKRRSELTNLANGGVDHRRILAEYSPHLLDQMISLVTASTLMSYCLYTIDRRTVEVMGTTRLMYTIPFVIYGLFRYLYLIHHKNKGGAPSRVLLTDGPLLLDVFLYVVAVLVILYSAR